MKRWIFIFVLLGIVALVLVVVALFRQAGPAEPVQTINVPPIVSQPETVPIQLSQADRQGATDIATLFVESFASYDPLLEAENINISIAYSTAKLQEELSTFKPQYLADRASNAALSLTTEVESVAIELRPAAGTIQARVVAHLAIKQRKSTGGAGQVTRETGDVFLVQIGSLWYVDDLAFDPPLLGFK